jgi:hypothetical protein
LHKGLQWTKKIISCPTFGCFIGYLERESELIFRKTFELAIEKITTNCKKSYFESRKSGNILEIHYSAPINKWGLGFLYSKIAV